MDTFLVIAGISFLAFLIIISRTIKIVPQAEAWLLERFGKYHSTLTAGLHFINPLFTRIAQKEDLREISFELSEQLVITRDNATIFVDGIVFYKVMDPKDAFYGIKNLRYAINNMAMTSLREVMGRLSLDESFSSRETISKELREILDQTTESWGTQITRVELRDISPPPEIQASMIKQMEAERNRRASVTEAEGYKQATLLRAEGEREARIATAEGEKRANILRAEGFAEARLTVAKAEAEAIRTSVAVIGDMKISAQYLIANKYIEAFQDIIKKSEGNKVVFMPYEATGVLSSLGSIKEILKS